MNTTPTAGSHARGARARCVATLACALLASGCTGGEILLLVDLRTDYAPGLEVSSVVTDIELDSNGGMRGRRASARLTYGQDIASGARIAEFSRIRAGTHTVIVRLFDEHGGLLATRTVRATVTTSTSVVAIITRRCRGVVCPGSGDAPDATECLDGRCVPPECETVEDCVEPSCTADADCPSDGCAVGACASGACLLRPRDDLCPVGLRCHPDDGCVEVDARDGGVDGGVDAGRRDSGPPPPCVADAECDDGVACTTDTCEATGCAHAPSHAACDDGVACTDDTCTATGCANAPNAAACDDGVACTSDSCGPSGCTSTPNDLACDDGVGCTDDTCTAAGCTNAPRHSRCGDRNPCTDDECTTSGCRNTNNSAPCDDGLFCNGADSCSGGSCSVHAGNPCNVGAGEVCSE